MVAYEDELKEKEAQFEEEREKSEDRGLENWKRQIKKFYYGTISGSEVQLRRSIRVVFSNTSLANVSVRVSEEPESVETERFGEKEAIIVNDFYLFLLFLGDYIRECCEKMSLWLEGVTLGFEPLLTQRGK